MTIPRVFEVYFKELYLPVSFASNPIGHKDDSRLVNTFEMMRVRFILSKKHMLSILFTFHVSIQTERFILMSI